MSQSTNDSYPTAIKVAILLRNEKLIAGLENSRRLFPEKGRCLLLMVKMGRTEMQDAVPMTVGQEFNAFAASLDDEIQIARRGEVFVHGQHGCDRDRYRDQCTQGISEKCAAHLATLTGKPIVPASDMLAATWDQQGFLAYSAALRSVAVKLSKIAGDLIF